MKTESDRAASFIDSMENRRQSQFLARLIYELTIAGRVVSSIESNVDNRASYLREINELQHLVSTQLMELLSGDTHSLPTTFLVSKFLEPFDRD